MQKKNKIIIFIGVIFIILIFFLILITIYLKTDLLKSNKQLFFKYLIEDNQMWYSFLPEKNEDGSLKSYISTGNIDFIYEYTKIQEVENDNISKILNDNFEQLKNIENLSGNLSSNVDKNNKKETHQLEILNNETKIMNFVFVRDDDKYAIKNDILKKYVGIQNSNINEFLKKMEIINDESIPSKINFENIMHSFFEIQPEDRKHIYETYKDIFIQTLDTKKYSSEKNKLININSNEYKTDLYTLTLTKEESIDLIINILQTLKKDSITLNIICNKIKIINPENKNTNINELVNQIDLYIEEIKKQEKNQTEFLKINVYKEKNNARRIDFSIEETKQLSLEYDIKDGKENLQISQNGLLNQPTTISYDFIDALLCTKKVKISKSQNFKKIQFVFYNIKDLYKNLIEKSNTDINNVNLDQIKNIFEYYKEKKDEELEISLNIDRYYERDNEFKTSIYFLVCNSKVGADINTKIKYTDNLQDKVNLNDKNSIMINNYSKQTIEKLLNDIFIQTKKILLQ